MPKCYMVSGIKHGKEKVKIFKNVGTAVKEMKKVEFQRGWHDLGVSEITCSVGKSLQKRHGWVRK